MHALVLDIVLACAALVAVLGLVDWFLSEQQKRVVSGLFVRAWSFLDDAKKTRLLLKFKLERPQFYLLLVSALLASLINIIQPINSAEIGSTDWWLAEAACIISIVVQVKVVLPHILDYLTVVYEEEGSTVGLFRLIFVLAPMLVILGFFVVPLLKSDFIVLRAAGLLIFVFVGTAFQTVILVLYLIFIAKLGLSVARPILASSEFIIRRIAESPKGPLVAITGLVGGVAGLLKLFVG